MSEVTTIPNNQISDFVSRAKAHRRPQTRVEGGFLKFNGKSGEWTMGQDEETVTNASVLLIVNGTQHGYIRWGESPPAKVFTSIMDELPQKPEPIDGVDQDGKEKTFYAQDARLIAGTFMGENDDLGQFVFTTSSMGGVENMDKEIDAIITKASDGTEFFYPLVKLTSEWYKRSTGKVYKPVFELTAWCDQNGAAETEAKLEHYDAEPEVEAEEEAPSRRRSRRKA
jgi:hypothetical protein